MVAVRYLRDVSVILMGGAMLGFSLLTSDYSDM